jgi:hypothetical protein
VKFAFAILAAFALLLAGCAGSAQQGGAPSAPGASATPPAQPAAVPPAQGSTAAPPAVPGEGNSTITLAQLSTHSTEADCWVGYDGKVYDVTAFIPNHKNYQALLVPLCGTSDKFKAAFEGKHGTSKVNVLESQPLMGTLSQ